MTACYPTYDMSHSGSQSMAHHHQSSHSMQQSNRTATLLAGHQQSQQSPQTQQPPQKDYSIPLHVDCSVEYELPNQAKPPVGARVEPLLMIHPCYFRKMESQRRSPFINNMPNPSSRSANSQSNVTTVSSSSTASTTHMSSSRRSNVLTATSNPIVAPTSAKNQSNAHLMTNPNVISSHPNQMQQQHMSHHSQNMQQNHHQNLQAQIDEYVQRQMVHISQQAQYPVGQQQQQQSNSQYNMPTQQHQHQMQQSGNWDRYLNVPNTSMLGKVNIPNQNAYKKSGKRHLTATCANSYSSGHLEGSLPNGITRWDEKTAMAAIPRDYQSGPESIPTSSIQQHQQQPQHPKPSIASVAGNGSLYRGASSQQAVLMSGKRDRDPMLSGGCIYSNSNNSNSNLTTEISNLASSGLWEPIQKSPMAAIPNNNYQAGPDSIPNNNHSSNSNKANSINGMTHRQPSGTTVIHHSQYPQQQQSHQPQQHIHQNDKLLNNNSNANNNNVITVKYRQYRNSHRMHPYIMSNMSAPSVNAALTGVSSYFPQLNGPFPQIQQVSCYNV
jgi:hypothetical protein